jgi:hypothetical protein
MKIAYRPRQPTWEEVYRDAIRFQLRALLDDMGDIPNPPLPTRRSSVRKKRKKSEAKAMSAREAHEAWRRGLEERLEAVIAALRA